MYFCRNFRKIFFLKLILLVTVCVFSLTTFSHSASSTSCLLAKRLTLNEDAQVRNFYRTLRAASPANGILRGIPFLRSALDQKNRQENRALIERAEKITEKEGWEALRETLEADLLFQNLSPEEQDRTCGLILSPERRVNFVDAVSKAVKPVSEELTGVADGRLETAKESLLTLKEAMSNRQISEFASESGKAAASLGKKSRGGKQDSISDREAARLEDLKQTLSNISFVTEVFSSEDRVGRAFCVIKLIPGTLPSASKKSVEITKKRETITESFDNDVFEIKSRPDVKAREILEFILHESPVMKALFEHEYFKRNKLFREVLSARLQLWKADAYGNGRFPAEESGLSLGRSVDLGKKVASLEEEIKEGRYSLDAGCSRSLEKLKTAGKREFIELLEKIYSYHAGSWEKGGPRITKEEADKVAEQMRKRIGWNGVIFCSDHVKDSSLWGLFFRLGVISSMMTGDNVRVLLPSGETLHVVFAAGSEFRVWKPRESGGHTITVAEGEELAGLFRKILLFEILSGENRVSVNVGQWIYDLFGKGVVEYRARKFYEDIFGENPPDEGYQWNFECEIIENLVWQLGGNEVLRLHREGDEALMQKFGEKNLKRADIYLSRPRLRKKDPKTVADEVIRILEGEEFAALSLGEDAERNSEKVHELACRTGFPLAADEDAASLGETQGTLNTAIGELKALSVSDSERIVKIRVDVEDSEAGKISVRLEGPKRNPQTAMFVDTSGGEDQYVPVSHIIFTVAKNVKGSELLDFALEERRIWGNESDQIPIKKKVRLRVVRRLLMDKEYSRKALPSSSGEANTSGAESLGIDINKVGLNLLVSKLGLKKKVARAIRDARPITDEKELRRVKGIDSMSEKKFRELLSKVTFRSTPRKGKKDFSAVDFGKIKEKIAPIDPFEKLAVLPGSELDRFSVFGRNATDPFVSRILEGAADSNDKSVQKEVFRETVMEFFEAENGRVFMNTLSYLLGVNSRISDIKKITVNFRMPYTQNEFLYYVKQGLMDALIMVEFKNGRQEQFIYKMERPDYHEFDLERPFTEEEMNEPLLSDEEGVVTGSRFHFVSGPMRMTDGAIFRFGIHTKSNVVDLLLIKGYGGREYEKAEELGGLVNRARAKVLDGYLWKPLSDGLGESERALDFAVGEGRDLKTAPGGLIKKISAVDFMSGPLEELKKQMPDLDTIEADWKKIPEPDGSFSLIFGLNAISYVPLNELDEVAGELDRLLKPAGGKKKMLFFTDLTPVRQHVLGDEVQEDVLPSADGVLEHKGFLEEWKRMINEVFGKIGYEVSYEMVNESVTGDALEIHQEWLERSEPKNVFRTALDCVHMDYDPVLPPGKVREEINVLLVSVEKDAENMLGKSLGVEKKVKSGLRQAEQNTNVLSTLKKKVSREEKRLIVDLIDGMLRMLDEIEIEKARLRQKVSQSMDFNNDTAADRRRRLVKFFAPLKAARKTDLFLKCSA